MLYKKGNRALGVKKLAMHAAVAFTSFASGQEGDTSFVNSRTKRALLSRNVRQDMRQYIINDLDSNPGYDSTTKILQNGTLWNERFF